jgi:hypothetical protein
MHIKNNKHHLSNNIYECWYKYSMKSLYSNKQPINILKNLVNEIEKQKAKVNEKKL